MTRTLCSSNNKKKKNPFELFFPQWQSQTMSFSSYINLQKRIFFSEKGSKRNPYRIHEEPFFFFPALVRIYLKSQKFCFCYTTTKTYNLLRLCRSTRAQACEISVFTEAEADIDTVRTVGRNTGRQKQMRIIHSRKWENRAWGSKPGSQTNAGELGNGTKEIRKHVKPARWCTLTWTKLCDEREVRVYKYTF